MLASFPASMVNQKQTDSGIPNRFRLNSSRFSAGRKLRQRRVGVSQLSVAREPERGKAATRLAASSSCRDISEMLAGLAGAKSDFSKWP
jgi:hypothetical protein